MTGGARTAEAWNQWGGQIVDGKFPLVEYLGAAGHGAVFLTERPGGPPRKAAIKLLPADDVTAEALFFRWKIASQLSHPDLIQLFEMGRGFLGGVSFAYILMEYAEEDLGQVDRPLTAAETIDLLAGIVKVLSYLHGKRFVHGHLKPSNILAVDDQLKISSDTIRPVGDWRSNLDPPGLSDPPEIAQQGASPAGDIWSVGVTLVDALTKQLPAWDGNEVAASQLESLPPRFRPIVSNCLQTDPRDRWTVSDLEKSLEAESQPPLHSPREPSSASVTKRRSLLATAIVVLALAASAIVSRVRSGRAAGALPAVEPQESKSGPVTGQPKPQEVQAKAAAPHPNPPAKSLGRDVLTQVLPDVPAKARNTIRGKVAISIRVRVDPNGSVMLVQNESPQSSRYFGNLALQAARRWKFEPADTGSSANPAEWNLHFQFVRDARHPVSVKAAPAR
ncbi:MAG: TonB family protein [Acidobacteriia bacterium]|nr:TonB family protein [Terriglobia bacterium]